MRLKLKPRKPPKTARQKDVYACAVCLLCGGPYNCRECLSILADACRIGRRGNADWIADYAICGAPECHGHCASCFFKIDFDNDAGMPESAGFMFDDYDESVSTDIVYDEIIDDYGREAFDDCVARVSRMRHTRKGRPSAAPCFRRRRSLRHK